MKQKVLKDRFQNSLISDERRTGIIKTQISQNGSKLHWILKIQFTIIYAYYQTSIISIRISNIKLIFIIMKIVRKFFVSKLKSIE